MWQWIKSNIFSPVANFFSHPVANFFSDIVVSIRGLFTRADDGRAQYQPILVDVVEEEEVDVTLTQTALPSVANKTPEEIVRLLQSDNNEPKNITDLPDDILSKAMPRAGIPDTQVTSVMNILSKTGRRFHSIFKQELADRAIIKQLWQAVIDDERETVVRLSNKHPQLFFRLLTQGAPKDFEIQSKYTFQNFNLEGENLFTAVVKRKQLEMIKTLLSCCKQFEKMESHKQAVEQARTAAFSQWTYHETTIDPTTSEEDIVIPPEYADKAKRLIDVFKTEPVSNGPTGRLSENTEKVLTALFNELIPLKAVKLDDYPDTELLYLAIRTAYRDNFRAFNSNWNQLRAACIRLFGLIQSLLTPETAEILCEGLINVVPALEKGEEIKISKEALAHKLKTGQPYYRSRRELLSGLGREFFVDTLGEGTCAAAEAPLPRGLPSTFWKSYVKQKQQVFRNYVPLAATAKPSPSK